MPIPPYIRISHAHPWFLVDLERLHQIAKVRQRDVVEMRRVDGDDESHPGREVLQEVDQERPARYNRVYLLVIHIAFHILGHIAALSFL